jgi:hypothetical protein
MILWQFSIDRLLIVCFQREEDRIVCNQDEKNSTGKTHPSGIGNPAFVNSIKALAFPPTTEEDSIVLVCKEKIIDTPFLRT